MAKAIPGDVLQHIRAAVGGDAPDGQLLERFARAKNEEAFAALLRRHGPMVLGVCRRILRQAQDAEDVCQATFLLLARKAAVIRKQASVGSWLYGVAYRLAVKAKAQGACRRAHERQAAQMRTPEAALDRVWWELQAVLDEELSGLLDKYRAALIACYLEGKTQEEAAQQLACPLGTLRSRLARGRAQLQKRLRGRGLTLSAGAFVAAFATKAADAAVPARLTGLILRAALEVAAGGVVSGLVSARVAALVEGGMKAMVNAKVRVVAILLLLGGLLVGGAGLVASGERAGKAAGLDGGSAPLARLRGEAAAAARGQKDPQSDALPSGVARDEKAVAKAEPLPAAAMARMGTTRFRHPNPLNNIVFAPGGKIVVSADYRGQVRFWQAPTGRLLRQLPGQPGSLIAVAPDGKRLATAGTGGDIQLWAVATGQPIRTLKGKHGHSVRSLAFSPDGKTLLAAIDQAAYLWDVATGKETAALTGHKRQVYAVAFSPDGKTIATGDAVDYAPRDFSNAPHCTVILWEAKTRKERRRFAAHHGWIYALAFSPDSQLLASASPYDTCLWQVATGDKLAKLEATSTVAFSPRSNVLATGGAVALWDADTRQKLRTLDDQVSYAGALAFSPDGRVVATGNTDGLVRLWDAATGKEVGGGQGHQGVVRDVAFSPDGALVASTSGIDGTLRLWGVATGAQLRKTLVRARDRRGWENFDAKSVRFAPDGKTLALATNAGVVKIFDVVTGRLVCELPHKGFISAVAYSPDGKYLASSAWHECAVRLWEAASGRLVHTIQPYGDGGRENSEVHAVAFSPDGKTLATSSSFLDRKNSRDTIHLWDLATGKEVRKFRPAPHPVIYLAFTADGNSLVSSAAARVGSVVEVWAVATGKRARAFAAPLAAGNDWRQSAPIALTPNGKLLGTSGSDNAVVIRELATGKEVRRLTGHKGPVTALAFAPDGQALVSGSQDTTLLLWRLAVPEGNKPAPPGPPDIKKLQEYWDALADKDAETAYRAMRALTNARDLAVAFLKPRLQPAGKRNVERIPQMVQDLGSAKPEVRMAAATELRLFGAAAEPALYAALRGKLLPGVREEVERLLATIAENPITPEERQRLRAVQVLEGVGTPAAVALLEALAKGYPTAAQTQDAASALARLTRRRQLAAVRVLTDEELALARRRLPGGRKDLPVADQGGAMTAVVFAADGRTVATASTDGTLLLRTIRTGKVLQRLKGLEGGANGAALTADGKRLAAAAGDGRVLLFNAATGRLLRELKGHTKAALCVAFAPDGRTLASGGADGTIRVWNADQGQELHRIGAPAPKVTAVTFTPDGKYLLSGGLVRQQDGFAGGVRFSQPDHVRVWDAGTGKLVGKLPVRGTSLALAPDGNTLVAGGLFCLIERNHKGPAFIQVGDEAIFPTTQLQWCDLRRGRAGRLVQGHGGVAVFAADGRTLLVVSGYHGHHETFLWNTSKLSSGADPRPAVRLLEARTGEEFLTGPAQEATAAALSPDGRTLVWGRRDGTLVFWDVAPEDALAAYAGKPDAKDLEKL